MDPRLLVLALSVACSSAFSIVRRSPSLEENETLAMRPEDVFSGIYSECVVYLSYSCVQKKTLKYLELLNEEEELPIVGDYVKFVKRESKIENDIVLDNKGVNAPLSKKIDEKIEEFFDNHILRITFANESIEEVNVGRMLDISEGRKKNSGGGGGGDSMKKKMMMMAMMCMKMKMMVMMPAMMGMMGMMSFKGMMLGALSLLISKILLIMKLMGGSGGGGLGGKGGLGGGAHGGGGDMAWMPAGGGGGWNAGGGDGGGGGGYNSNGEWQSRSGWEILRSPHHQGRQLILGTVSSDRKKRDLDAINYVDSSPEAVKLMDTKENDHDDDKDIDLDFDGDEEEEADEHVDLEDLHEDLDEEESEEDEEDEQKKKKKKPKIKKRKNKKKGNKQSSEEGEEKEETISSYFTSLKEAVEDNMWD